MDEKTCTGPCARKLPLDEFHRRTAAADGRQYQCKRCLKVAKADWRARNLERVRTTDAAKMRDYREQNRESVNAKARAARAQLREEVLAHYGNACACCEERRTEFLTIDHVDGDGAAHRRQIGQSATYAWLRRQGFPDGFRVLCANCNWSRGLFGYCPHERERLHVVA